MIGYAGFVVKGMLECADEYNSGASVGGVDVSVGCLPPPVDRLGLLTQKHIMQSTSMMSTGNRGIEGRGPGDGAAALAAAAAAFV